jgi:type VI secretion system protein ImpE
MTPDDLYKQGDLDGAIAALTQEVKAAPTDLLKRVFLFELLCFAGEVERAVRQLDVIGQQDSAAETEAQVYRNLVHTEQTRRRVFAEGARPEFLLDPPAWVQGHLDALGLLRRGDRAAALEAFERSTFDRQVLRGRAGEEAFEGIADWDDVVGPFLEFALIRDYIWLPFEQLRELEILRPEKPRDLIWAPVRLTLVDGMEHRGYVPVLYCGSHEHTDTAIKLGRTTDWSSVDDPPVRGIGHRVLRIGERDLPLLDVGRVAFDVAAP